MANKNSSLFSNITKAAKTTDKEKTQKKPGFFSERVESLKDQKNTELRTTLRINPDRCKMWGKHNRNYELLNEHRCADLIEGFKAQGKQEFPAIVRRLPKSDSEHDFEVICGARRHWTASYLRNNKWPDFKFFIEIRELSDEEAFRLADIENRDREDICDYERALDYKEAMMLYYNNEQKSMAERLECDRAWLSRLLKLADMPKQVVEAYCDVTDIVVEHYKKLAKYLADPAAKKRIITKASSLKDKALDGKTVISELMKAGQGALKPTASSSKSTTIQTAKGKDAISWVAKKNAFTLSLNKGCSKTEMNDAFKKFMGEMWN